MSQHVRDVMTYEPETVPATATVSQAAAAMRDADVGDVIVVDDAGRAVGIMTDRDIVVRTIAEGRDPGATPLREVASKELVTLSPDDAVDDALRIMGSKAVRRLPVVEAGRPVGVLSLGDLAIVREPESALADISAAEPNH